MLAYMLGRHCHRRVTEERGAPRHHLVQDDAEGIDVAAGVDTHTLGLLRGEVRGRAHDRPGLGEALLGVHGAGDPEVRDLDGALFGDEHIARLDVAVDHSVAMRVRQRPGDIGGDFGGPVGVQRSGRAQDRRQGPAVDELHDDEVGTAVLAPVEDGHDVGVRQVGCRLGLAAEAFHERPVHRQLGKEHLESDRAVEQLVVGAIHLGHAAACHQMRELVASREHPGCFGRLHAGQSLRLAGSTLEPGTVGLLLGGDWSDISVTVPPGPLGSWSSRWGRQRSRR